MLSFKNVVKVFGSKTALNNVSFKIDKAEIVGFLGLNGAGKTTSMRLSLGIQKPVEGEVRLFGKDPVENRAVLMGRIGYLPENNPLYTYLKVKEYLDFVKEIKGAGSYDDLVAKIGLEDRLNDKIENLSRGYKQRVGLCAALIGNPDLLILDEPTSGLDPLEQEKIREIIKNEQKKKRSVIFSTHILSEVEDVADRLIVIHKGEIVYDGKKPKGKGSVEKLFKKLVK
ncbi:MAG: hypothetical protein KatS3mg090_0065 [Patescibacteria group bacterium]|nr:MAG: hypothetical protein KatS3mg090_0065 [Patescibacteria group bacterium]